MMCSNMKLVPSARLHVTIMCLALITVVLGDANVVNSDRQSIMNNVKQVLERTDQEVAENQDCSRLLTSRLFHRIVPIHYDLIIKPDLDEFSFEGFVKIHVHVRPTRALKKCPPGYTCVGGLASALMAALNLKHTPPSLFDDEMILHADPALKIHKVSYVSHGKNKSTDGASNDGVQIAVPGVCKNTAYGTLVLGFGRKLESDSYGTLLISFSGLISDDLMGFNRSPYWHPDDPENPRYVASTQFEATAARRAFPCFDEPNFKATFDLTLIHRRGLMALANTDPIFKTTIEDGGLEVVSFERTPPMSTYLVAFAIGEFDTIERKVLNSKLTIRVRTPPGFGEQGRFALEVACRAIGPLQDYFGVESPLKKIDILALADFESSAMENWGLITARSEFLLVDERHTSPRRKAEVASIMIHELAHQWFGNLVTLTWWTDLWLNEGFATWVQYNMTQALYPEFDYGDYYIIDSLIPALKSDTSVMARPVRPKRIPDGTNIDDMFDAFAYDKAAGIIRFLYNDYLGPAKFKEAIQHYIRKHEYDNARTLDLWDSMEAKSGLSIKEPMSAWIMKVGHPLVKVTEISSENQLKLEQIQFPTSVVNTDIVGAFRKWVVPVTLEFSDGAGRVEEFRLTFASRNMYTKVPDWFKIESQSHWLKLNVNFTGFYQVDYSEKLLRKLHKPIETRVMRPTDRANVINDALALLRVGRIRCDAYLNLLAKYQHETSGLVLVPLVEAFGALWKLFRKQQKVRPKLEHFGRRLFSNVYITLGGFRQNDFPLERHLDKLGRVAALNLLVELDYDLVIDSALSFFESSGGQVDPEYRDVVYKSVAKAGSDSQYETLFAMFTATHSPEEQFRLANAILSANERQRLEKAWQWFKQPEVRLGNKVSMLNHAMLANEAGQRFIMELLSREAEELRALDEEKHYITMAVQLAIEMGPEMLDSIDSIFQKLHFSKEWQTLKINVKNHFVEEKIVRYRGGREMEMMLDLKFATRILDDFELRKL